LNVLQEFLLTSGTNEAKTLLLRGLDKCNDLEMAVTLLNSKNAALETAARNWAKAHGYDVTSVQSSGSGATWGGK
jgi:hypothetical protein